MANNMEGLGTMLSFLQQGSNPGQADPLPEMQAPRFSQPDTPQAPQMGGSGLLKGILGNLVSGYVGNKLQTHMDNEAAKEQGDALAPIVDEQLSGISKDSPYYAALSSTRRQLTSGDPATVKFGLKRYDDVSSSMMKSSNPEMKNHLQVINDEQGNSYYVDTASGGAAVPINGPGGTQIRSPQYYGPAISNRVTAEQTPQIVQTTDAQGHPIFVTKGQAAGVAPTGQPQTQQPQGQPGRPVNNPGNLRPPGESSGFQQFKTPEDGLSAMTNQLGIYGSKYGLNTLRGVINRWAPPNVDGNNTDAYIENVSKQLGISPDAKIDLSNPTTQLMVASGIIRQEGNGWKQPPASAPSTPMRGQSPTEQATATAEALLPVKNQEEINKAQVDIQKEDVKNKNKIQTDLTKTGLEQQAATVSPEKIKGRDSVSMLLDDLAGYYDELDKLGGISNTKKGVTSNMAAAFNTSDMGQMLGRATGSKDQAIRDKIAAAKSTLVPQVMKATGMTSQMLNSEMELQNFLKTLTDPKVDVSVAKQQLKTMDSLYGKSSVGGGTESSGNKEPPHPGYTGYEQIVGGVKYKLRKDDKWDKVK